MRTIKHPTLGEVEVLVEVMHKEKHFFLIKRRVKKWKAKVLSWEYAEEYELLARSWEKSIEHHYCLWGNTNDPTKMGTTKLTTPSGRKPASNRINKMFLEMVSQSENLTFSK